MPIPVWPPSLPQIPLKDGYSENIASNLIRSESDSGVVKVRRKGSSKPYQVTGSFNLTLNQKNTLRTFIEDTLVGGALRFEFPHPTQDTIIEARIVPESDDALCSFSPSGLNWSTSLTFEVLP